MRSNNDDVVARLQAPVRNLAVETGFNPKVTSRNSLVDFDKKWDDYNLDELFKVDEVEEPYLKDIYVLRLYWRPATILNYHASVYAGTPLTRLSENGFFQDSDIERRLVKCATPQYAWMDRTKTYIGNGEFWNGPLAETRQIMNFNMIESGLSVDSVDSASGDPVPDMQARQESALLALPFVPPFGPVKVGHAWEVSVGESHVRYSIASRDLLGCTQVLVIKRQGMVLLTAKQPAFERREYNLSGLAVWAPGRGILVEDRSLLSATGDRHHESGARAVFRLVNESNCDSAREEGDANEMM